MVETGAGTGQGIGSGAGHASITRVLRPFSFFFCVFYSCLYIYIYIHIYILYIYIYIKKSAPLDNFFKAVNM